MSSLSKVGCYVVADHQSYVIVLSHWPHVAQQVEQQVPELVAQLVSENVAGTVHTGHMLSNKLRHIFDTFSFNV